jgi:hypothetical protein
MKIKLSDWNWFHLFAPYALGIIIFKLFNWAGLVELGVTFAHCMLVGYFLVIAITSIPHMGYDQKTGNSFRTKDGVRFDEYKKVQGDPYTDYKLYINILHGICLVIDFIFFAKG